MIGLFDENLEISINKPSAKDIVKKLNTGIKADIDTIKVLKSKKITLLERLAIITENVLRVLGKQKNNVLVIRNRVDLHNYITSCIDTGRIAIDTETNNSLDPVTCKLMGPCFYAPGLKQAYVPINHTDLDGNRLDWQLTELDIKEELQRVLESDITVIMHNGKFDYEVIKCTCGLQIKPEWDTIIAARLIDENEEASLKTQYTSKIDPSQAKYDIEKLFENIEYAYVDPDIFALYAATDSMMTDKLYELQKAYFDKPENSKLYWVFKNIEMPIVAVTAEMELRGVAVDTKLGERLKLKYSKSLESLDNTINDILSKLEPIVTWWKLSGFGNARNKIWQPKKSKRDETALASAYPFIDQSTGKRYTWSKSGAEQLTSPINLASPTQLAILFYDILCCPAVDSKKPRATGEEELELIGEKITDGTDLKEALLDRFINKDKYLAKLRAELDSIDRTKLGSKAPASEPKVKQNKLKVKSIFETVDVCQAIESCNSTDDANPVPLQSTADINYSAESFEAMVNAAIDSADQLCKAILKRRGIIKLISTYIDVIPTLATHWADGRIRFHLNSLGTDTGRYSSGGKIKFIEDGEPVTVSGINIQNIPSHNKEIRMLFCGSTKEHKVEEENDCFTVPETDEIETVNGWKYCKDLVIGDKIRTNDGSNIIKNIIVNDKKYLLYV